MSQGNDSKLLIVGRLYICVDRGGGVETGMELWGRGVGKEGPAAVLGALASPHPAAGSPC